MTFKKILNSVLKLLDTVFDFDEVIRKIGDRIEERVHEGIERISQHLLSSLLELFCYAAFLTFTVLAVVEFLKRYLAIDVIYAILALFLLGFGLLINRSKQKQFVAGGKSKR